MANNYNITMKEYNGTDYDGLYPKTISQQVLINNGAIANMLGITADNPNLMQALMVLAFGTNLIEFGHYTGDGNYGSSNPNTISFTNFDPKFVIITGHNTGFFVKDSNTGFLVNYASSSEFPTVTWGNKSLSWYGTSANKQLNDSSTEFYYIAFNEYSPF